MAAHWGSAQCTDKTPALSTRECQIYSLCLPAAAKQRNLQKRGTEAMHTGEL